MSGQGFIIHLARATQRRPQVEALVAACPWRLAVCDAVDGSALSDEAVAGVMSSAPLFAPPYPFAVGRGELACFLSHRAIWQRMVEQDIKQALIFEDDAEVGPDFPQALALASTFAGEEGFVQFQTRQMKGPRHVVMNDGGVCILRPGVVPRRTSAQLVGIAAARRLLASARSIDRPVDGFLQLVWATGQPIHCVDPSGVTDRTDAVGGSVAQSQGSAGLRQKLRRAYHRAKYRLAIVRRSHAAEELRR